MIRSDPEAVAEAAEILRAGGLVAFPTETVYGLAADATNGEAVRRLYAVKGRPASHPSIVHLADDSWLAGAVQSVPESARKLAAHFWPGPLTLVLKCGEAIAAEVTGGRDTVGVRVPAHPLAVDVIRALGRPVVAPSANRFGRISPTTAEHVEADLGDDIDLILDGGPCRVGVESTIVDCTVEPPVILRPGGITAEALGAVLGTVPSVRHQTGGAPGTLPAHYAPRARLILIEPGGVLEAVEAARAEGSRVAVLAPEPPALPEGVRVVTAPLDPAIYAHELYGLLRMLDEEGVDVIVATPVKNEGLGVAINDRLRRAAGGRS